MKEKRLLPYQSARHIFACNWAWGGGRWGPGTGLSTTRLVVLVALAVVIVALAVVIVIVTLAVEEEIAQVFTAHGILHKEAHHYN